jgi:hypothetical protein
VGCSSIRADPVVIVRTAPSGPARAPAAEVISARFGFPFVYAALVAILAVATFGAGVLGPWKAQPKPVTVTRTVAPATAKALVAAWGKPDSSVDGAQVNAQLAGLTCVVYQGRKAVLCYVA